VSRSAATVMLAMQPPDVGASARCRRSIMRIESFRLVEVYL
jgi:hypothetical protein